MEDFVKIFMSPQGDVYHITLSESNDILSKSVLDALDDVHIAGVDLRRLEGTHVTDQKVLTALANTIAEGSFLKILEDMTFLPSSFVR